MNRGLRLWHRSCSVKSVKTVTLTVILVCMANCAFCAELNPRDIVAKSIFNYHKDWNAALDFTYTEHEVNNDASGKPKTVEISQVSVLDGTPYSRLIGKNGHPLSAEEAGK